MMPQTKLPDVFAEIQQLSHGSCGYQTKCMNEEIKYYKWMKRLNITPFLGRQKPYKNKENSIEESDEEKCLTWKLS